MEADTLCIQTPAEILEPIVESFFAQLRDSTQASGSRSALTDSAELLQDPAESLAAWRAVSIPDFRSLGASQREQLVSRLSLAWKSRYAWFEEEDLESIEQLIFAVQTYAAVVIRQFTLLMLQHRFGEECGKLESDVAASDTFGDDFAFGRFGWCGFQMPIFEWWRSASSSGQPTEKLSSALSRLNEFLGETIEGAGIALYENEARFAIDWFRPLIETLFPSQVRKALGEFYTPNWLVKRTLDNLDYTGSPSVRVLDPTCGSGAFIVEVLSRWLQQTSEDRGADRSLDLRTSEWPIQGIDLNPLAVFAARANYVIACAARMYGASAIHQVPIFHADTILSPIGTPPSSETETEIANTWQPSRAALPQHFDNGFDLIVGNPPWVGWETLTPEYRRATESLWHRYRLFTAKGMQTILGHGKKDLSMLISYAVTDRFLKPGGKLSFIVSNSLFRNHGAGQGFRQFQFSDDKRDAVAVQRVDDYSSVEPFRDISTSSCVFIWEKGAATTYPIAYRRWSPARSTTRVRASDLSMLSADRWRCAHEFAVPAVPAQEHSSWLIGTTRELETWRPLLKPSPYQAYEGVNTGGANGVYWLQLIEHLDDGLVRVRNLPEFGKKAIPSVEAVLETRFLYPLIRGVQMRRWRATVDSLLLFVQDPKRRQGIDIETLRKEAPKTWDYLRSFERVLIQRAAYQRFFHRTGKQRAAEKVAPFYSMFNVGPYTLAPYKVAWHRMKSPLEAAVVAATDDKPPLPQETHAFIPVDSRAHAIYLAALLNSHFFNRLAEATSQRGGKSFGSPHLLERLYVPAFDPNSPAHQQLVRHATPLADGLTPSDPDRLEHMAATVFAASTTGSVCAPKAPDVRPLSFLAEP